MQETNEGMKEKTNLSIQQENQMLKRKIKEWTLKSQLSKDEEYRYQNLIIKTQLLEQIEKTNQALNGIGLVLSNIGKLLDERLNVSEKIIEKPIIRNESSELDDEDEEDNQDYSYEEEEVPETEPKDNEAENWYDPSPTIKEKKKRA